MKNVQICTRCVYDETMPSITFDDEGVCNYCHMHDQLDRQYPTGEAGQHELHRMVEEIKEKGKGRKYDCIIGVSGGCDSSYLIHWAVEMGLRPLAVHFDNTWNSAIAQRNIHLLLDKLGVDLWTYVVDNIEYNDIYRSFLVAGIPEAEAPTDIALTTVAYLAAEKFGVKYILEGHSFRTEGISPLGWIYMDGKYIESVHRRHGRVPMKTYPNLTLSRFLRFSAITAVKRLRPLWYIDYVKEDAKKFLAEKYGWEWYGGHHLENRFTAFYHRYLVPRRQKLDGRLLGYAAMVRSHQLDRTAALELLNENLDCPDELVQLVQKRLGLSAEEFEACMTLPLKNWHDYETYKKKFELLRPVFWVLLKLKRVPESFYMKFCKPMRG